MQAFNDATGGQGIVQDIDFLANSDPTTYLIADKVRNCNNWIDVCKNDLGGGLLPLYRWQRTVHHVGARSLDIYAGICERHAQNVLNLNAKFSLIVHPLPFYHPVVVMMTAIRKTAIRK